MRAPSDTAAQAWDAKGSRLSPEGRILEMVARGMSLSHVLGAAIPSGPASTGRGRQAAHHHVPTRLHGALGSVERAVQVRRFPQHDSF